MFSVGVFKNWASPDLLRQSPGIKGVWSNVNFKFEHVSCADYVIVLNYVPKDIVVTCSPDNIWAIMQEPFLPQIFNWINQGHNQYAQVFTPHSDRLDPKYSLTQTCLPWHVNKDYDELLSIEVPDKSKTISCISSNKTIFPGHKIRCNFVEAIRQYKQLNIDSFGYGINPIENKWEGLAPYKYSIAIENSKSEHYWTEKVADCFLAHTLPIYYGCTNLEEYFPAESFVRIDVEDISGSIATIKQVLKDDPWEKRLPAIKKARDLVLNKYQLFPFLVDRINADDGARREKKAVYIRGYNKEIGFVKKPELLVSVVVCTYNRQDMLPDCLISLLHQTFNPAQYEVIVVNNNSSDNTERIAQEFVQGHANFHLITERKQGLSHARNTGYAEAHGEYVAFIDDDARAPDNWLEIAAKIIAEHHPDIFGGPVNALFEGQPPEWYRESYGRRGDMGETGFITEGFIVGTNIFFRKGLLEEYGGFDPELGMKGDSVGYHEETALVYKAFSEKRRVYYSGDLVVADLLPAYKHSLAFFMYARYKAGFDGVQLWGQKSSANNMAELVALIDNSFNEMDFALRKRDVKTYAFPENYVVEKLSKNFIEIGKLVKLIQNRCSVKRPDESNENLSALELVRTIHRTTGVAKFILKLCVESISYILKK